MALLKRPLQIENSDNLKGYGGSIDASTCVYSMLLHRKKKKGGGGGVGKSQKMQKIKLTFNKKK